MIMDRTKIYYLHFGDNVPFYVGKTRNEYHRLANHKKTFGDNIHMKIISEVLNWRKWEKYYIKKFKNQGYNLQNKNNGGGGPEKWTKESIQKIKSHPTRGKKISESNKGKSKSNKGKLFTEEHKQKIKQTRGFLKTRKNTWQNTPVLQYDLDGKFIKEWSSQVEATKYLNKTGDGIGACCRGRQKNAYGYIWKFKN
jgi:hypothetical protein